MQNLRETILNFHIFCRFYRICFSSASGTVIFDFTECGGMKSNTSSDETILTTYVHHRASYLGVQKMAGLSLMTKIKVECRIR